MHATVIRMQKVAAVGNALRVRGLQLALRPARLLHAAPVLLQIPNEVNAEIHLVFDARRPGWNQSPCSFDLFAHDGCFDAQGTQKLPFFYFL